jgi:6-pyruvoyltetrahydropterin/6-carboxytetrahydropterin synthase
MSNIRITKYFTFEMAHVLKGYDGPCKHIHGHSYGLYVTLIGIPISNVSSPKKGMVMDFKDLKAIVKKQIVEVFDHSLVISSEHEPDLIDEVKKRFGHVNVVDYQPTSENLLVDFAGRISDKLPHGVKLHNLKLCETATAYSEWYADDNK